MSDLSTPEQLQHRGPGATHTVRTADARRVVATSRPIPVVSGWKRFVLLAIASLFVALGAVGVVLPGLPTTPFLLVASYCLVRSSPRLNAALLRSRFFGPLLRDWQEHGGVRRNTKISASLIVIIAVGITSYSVRHIPMLALLIGLLALVGLGVIWRLPQLRVDADSGPPTPHRNN